MTQIVSKVRVQLTEDCSRDFYIVDDGTAAAFCQVPFVNGVPVSDAAPMPVDGDSEILTYKTIAASGTVATTTGTLVPAGTVTDFLVISTLPGVPGNVFLRADGSGAVLNTGIPLVGGGASVTFGKGGYPMPAGPITAITDAGSIISVAMAGG